MSVSPISKSYDNGNNDLELLGKIYPDMQYFTDSGWIGKSACGVGDIALPVKKNTRWDTITMYYQPVLFNPGVVEQNFSNDFNSAGWDNHHDGMSFGDPSSISFSLANTSFGKPLNFKIQFGANANNSQRMIMTGIVLSGLVDSTLPDEYPAGGGNPPPTDFCDVEVIYNVGSGPVCLHDGQDFTVKNGKTGVDKTIQFTLSKPITITFQSEYQWHGDKLEKDPWIILESPPGKITFEGHISDYKKPSDLNDLYLATRVTIYCPADAYLNMVTMNVHDIFPGNTGTDATGTVDSAGIIDAIDRFNNKVAQDSKNIEDALKGLPADLINQFLAGTPLDLHGLAVAIATIINGLSSFIDDTITGNLKLPDEIINSIKGFISNTAVKEGQDLAVYLLKVFFNVDSFITDKIGFTANTLGKSVKDQGGVIDKLLANNYTSVDQFYNDLKNAGTAVEGLQFVQNGFALVFGIIYFLKSKIDVADIFVKRMMLGQYTPNIVDAVTITRDLFKGAVTEHQFYNHMASLGYNETQADNIYYSMTSNPTIEDVKLLYLRNELTKEQVYTRFLDMGLVGEEADITFKAFQRPPGPSDITRIADKHIFNNDIPAIFGQYSETDQGYFDSMKQHGISEDWTKKLWAAHWSLPGLQDAFAMYHRGIISEQELSVFFALTDILPFFREKLKLLNYSLITRVDVRRMYSVGVYNETDVYNAYKKLGYADLEANKLTQFTVLHERQSDQPAKVKIRALTESMVVKAYKEGLLTENEAVTRLGNVGYLANDARLILQIETQTANLNKLSDKTQEYHDKTLTLVLSSFINGVISETEARNYLTSIGVPLNQIQAEINYAKIQQVVKLKSAIIDGVKKSLLDGLLTPQEATTFMLSRGFIIPEINIMLDEISAMEGLRNKSLTRAELEKLAKAGIIDQNTYMQELGYQGYSDKHIAWLTLELYGE